MAPRKRADGVARAVELRSNQWFNIDFFRIGPSAGGQVQFRNALREMIARPGAGRSVFLRDGRVDFHHGHEDGAIIEGEIGRVRTHDTPSIACGDCSVREIDLEDDQGITERTAFLFDCQRGALVLHSRREALSASRICELLDQVAQNRDEFFEYSVILNPSAEADYERMKTIREVSVSYTNGAQNIQKPDRTTLGFLRSMASVQPEVLTVTMSAQSTKKSHLSIRAARQFIAKAMSVSEDGVDAISVRGFVGDNIRTIDLIEDRLRMSVKEEVRGRNASYEQRRRIVRNAYEAKQALL
jgi:hypothetical protein